MFLDYYPGNSLAHRLDVRTKMVGFLAIIVLAFTYRHPGYNAAIAALLVALTGLFGLPIKRLWGLLAPILPVFVLIIIFSGYSYGPNSFSTDLARSVAFYSWPGERLPVSTGGLLLGLTLLIRIAIMVLASAILTMTTPLDDFLQLMQKLRVPYEVSFVVATGIRFIPTMERKAHMVLEAQKARGARLETGGVIQRIKAYVPIMVPLIVDSLRMSENLAMAMLNRGYGASRRWTTLRPIHVTGRDYAAVALCLAVAAAGIWLAMQGHGRL